MTAKTKNIIYSAILFVSVLVVYLYRKSQLPTLPQFMAISGETMGTTYHIQYFDHENRNFKTSIDSLLIVFNKSLNTYLPDSEITRFNQGDSSLVFDLPFFLPVLKKSYEIAQTTDGAFDPTVMPLVRAWGFGPGNSKELDSAQVDSIKQFIGYQKIEFNTQGVSKRDPRVQLDFSAIAKGYGVDVVADFLKSKDIENLFVEIGGEVVAVGKQLKNNGPWTVGILDPESTLEDQRYLAIVSLDNEGLATSGNYFNYRMVNGRRISHTMDPSSGYPVQRDILSASVFAEDCMTADGWATACMVMGYKKAIEHIAQHQNIKVFLIYSGEDGTIKTYTSPGLETKVKLQNSTSVQ